jgi:hypothetical protein
MYWAGKKNMIKSRNLINKKHFIFKHLYNIQLILLFADNIFAKLDIMYIIYRTQPF